ncbi:MAG: hypothetical protein NZ750_02370 [Anaerolineae bacterium]|nr:hypothetical protein [Anaerolineae bacterium]MDW8173475.1 hypothetical protein [Anaerolineae bacterium]
MSFGATQGKAWARADWLVLLVLVPLTALLFTPIILPQFREGASSDYPAHMRFAAQINSGQETTPPSPNRLHSWAVGVGLRLLGLPLEASTLLVSLLTYGLSWTALYVLLLDGWGEARVGSRLGLAGLSLALLTFGPLSLLLGDEPGAAPLSTVYHSPTFMLARLLALLQTIVLVRAFWRKLTAGWPMVALAALLSLLSTLARPNYSLAFGPALVLLALAWHAKRWRVDGRLLWLGGLLPMALVLVLQYVYLFIVADPQRGLALSPLGWYGLDDPDEARVLLRLVLSLALPLAIWFLYPRASASDSYLPAMLPVLLLTVLQAYLLVELGPSQGHGNWTWGYLSALFVVYALSTRLWLIQWRLKGRWTWREMVFGLILAFHVLSGALYYLRTLLIYWP